MTPDTINGAFEFVGALMLAVNVRQLWRHRRVAGVHWGTTAFFTSWGLWNLFYYPALGQWVSFVGGSLLVAMNALWLVSLAVISVRQIEP